VTPLVRYLMADVVRAQKWTAPLLVFLASLLVTTPTAGPVLPTYAISAATLVPVAMWFTVVVFHNEEPAQAAITMAVAGGFGRVRPAKVVTALVGTFGFGLFAFGYITVNTLPQATPVTALVGLVEYVMCGVTGVAFGSLISRPILPKIAWTVVLGLGICMAQLLVRHVPPVNAMIQLYAGDAPEANVGSLLVIAAETLVLAAVVTVAANLLARTRT
jgi:hypothetical protein